MSLSPMPVEAERLFRRYLAYTGLYTLAASIIWGVNTLFLLDAGLSIAGVFVANSAFSFGMLVFEIPTGVTADTVGRRVSFLLSVAVLGATTLAYVGLARLGTGLAGYVVVSVLIGVGFTFYSGATEAWLVDGLRHHGFDGELDRIFGRSHTISGAAMIVGTVGGGILGQLDLAIPFLVRSGLLGALFVVAYRGMHDDGFAPRRVSASELPGEAVAIGGAGIRFLRSRRPLRLVMYASAIQMGFFVWAWYAWQPYFLELLERDAVWVAGVVAALLGLATMVGNNLVTAITRRCGRRTTVFVWVSAVFALAMAGVGLVADFVVALVLLLIAAAAIGVQTPVKQAFIHAVVPTDERATVVSIDSMISGGVGAAAQPALGAMSESRGFSAAYLVGGLATLLSFPIMYAVRRTRNEADLFVGGLDRSSPTPPTPTISLVDGEVEISGV